MSDDLTHILAILDNEQREWEALVESDLAPRSEFIAGGLAALADLRMEITGDRIRPLGASGRANRRAVEG